MTMFVLLLSALILVIVFILISHFRLVKQYEQELEGEHDQRIKMTEFYDILIRWVELYQEKEVLSKWIKEKGYKKIAVYGMRELGILLYRELLQEGLDVCCAIDKNADNLNRNHHMEILKPTKELPNLDVIIVSAPHYYEQIKKEMAGLTEAEIVSIEDIIFEM